MTISFGEDAKRATKSLISTTCLGSELLDRYHRSKRVRRARAFLEAGGVFPADHEAILRDFAVVAQNTQLSIAGIANIEAIARHVVSSGRSGAFVECGTWRGGALGYWARSFLRNGGAPHTSSIWGFDSFEGMPQMTEQDGEFTARWLHQRPLAELPGEMLRGQLTKTGLNVALEQDVWDMLASSGYPQDRVHVVKGWFQNSLPPNADKIGPIAVLRLDGDFYESTRVCLEQLYDRVVSGGVVILDDYGVFPGCKQATDEFFTARRISAPLLYVDVAVRYFFKP